MDKKLISENSEEHDEPGDIYIKDATEIDIFSKTYGFDEEFVDKMLNKDCKWKDKKEAFDNFTKLTSQSKIKTIKNTDRTYFIEMVKKLLKEPNINVVLSIINALNNLSLGLNSNFFESKDLFSYLIVFLKEKKESFINSLIVCLCNFSLFIGDNIINEKLLNYYSGKTLCNVAKINLCTLIEKLIDKKKNIQINSYIPFIIKIANLLNDSNPEVREKSSKLMAFINYRKKDTLAIILKSINLDDRRINKIKDYEKLYINISCNNTNIKNVETNNKVNSNLKEKILGEKIEKEKAKNNKNINDNIKNYPQNVDNENKSKSKSEWNTNISSNNNLALIKEYLIDNMEEIISYVHKNINNLDNSLFNSLKWTERKEGFTIINNFFLDEKNTEEIQNSYDYYFKYILMKNKFFNDKNIVVLNESLLCIKTLIDKIKNFSKQYYRVIITLLTNKLSDKKLLGEISEIINKLINNVTRNEVIPVFINTLKDKSIIILKEGIGIIKNTIDININNNIDDYPLQEIINFCIEIENNPNNMLRKASTQLLCSLYKILDKDIYNYLKNIKESTMKIINEEFNKISKGENAKEEMIKQDINEENECIDISDKITEKMIKDLTEGKWTEKKKVIEQIEEIISEGNQNILSKGLNELYYAIKKNLSDGNKNIVKFTIILITKFISALSPGLNLKSFVNLILSDVISNFSETKNQIRDESIKCINKLIDLIGIDYIIGFLPIHLKTKNLEMKIEILNILFQNKKSITNQKECKKIIIPLIDCLLDKNLNVRNVSKEIIHEIMKYVPSEYITNYINKLKPSYKEQINSIIFNDKSSKSSDKNITKGNKKNKVKNFIESPQKGENIINDYPEIQSKNINHCPVPIDLDSQVSINNNLYDEVKLPKSPLIPNKSNNSKYNFNIIDVLPPEESELANYINALYGNDIQNKNIALIEIKKILVHSTNSNNIRKEHIKQILLAFNNLLSLITSDIKTKKSNIDKNEIILLRYLLDDYLYISNKKSFINNIDDDKVIYSSYEKLFLIISENESISHNYGAEIINIINKIILWLLTNFNETSTIIALIQIILDYKSNLVENQICSFSIKCLDKFRKILLQIQNKIDNNLIFVTFYKFFNEFSKTNKNLETHNNNEKNALLMINYMISEYINIYNNSIWDIYKESLDDDMIKFDIYFKRTIETLMKERNSKRLFESKSNISCQSNQDNKKEFIEDLYFYVNTLKEKGNKMNDAEKNDYYCQIVNLLRITEVDFSVVSNIIKGEMLSKIFELYYGINSIEKTEDLSSLSLKQSQKEKNKIKSKGDKSTFEQLGYPKNSDKFDLTEKGINTNKKEKEISEQSKRILEYKKKYESLTDNKNKDKNKENIPLNQNNETIVDNNFIKNTKKKLDELTEENEKVNKDSLIKMKKKLEEIRLKNKKN